VRLTTSKLATYLHAKLHAKRCRSEQIASNDVVDVG